MKTSNMQLSVSPRTGALPFAKRCPPTCQLTGEPGYSVSHTSPLSLWDGLRIMLPVTKVCIHPFNLVTHTRGGSHLYPWTEIVCVGFSLVAPGLPVSFFLNIRVKISSNTVKAQNTQTDLGAPREINHIPLYHLGTVVAYILPSPPPLSYGTPSLCKAGQIVDMYNGLLMPSRASRSCPNQMLAFSCQHMNLHIIRDDLHSHQGA